MGGKERRVEGESRGGGVNEGGGGEGGGTRNYNIYF